MAISSDKYKVEQVMSCNLKVKVNRPWSYVRNRIKYPRILPQNVMVNFLDLFSVITESQCLALALINKNQSSRGYWGRLVVEDQRGVLRRATPQGFGCHTWSCVFVLSWFMRAFIITCYMISEYSELYLPAIRIYKRITWLICSCLVGWGTRWLR